MRYQVPVKYWYGVLQRSLEPEMKLLDSLLTGGDHVIDIGGNRGIYTYQLWRKGARVEVFEPNPACNRVLEAWAEGKASVQVHSVALSSEAGEANLHIPVDASGVEHDASASIEHAGFAHSRDQLVALKTLDSYGFKDISVIKIDVEGHEYSVIEGAAATIAASCPALLVEIEQRHIDKPIAEVFDLIQGFGYQGYFIGPQGLTPLKGFDLALHQSVENFGSANALYINNFLFLHGKRLERGEYQTLINSRVLP